VAAFAYDESMALIECTLGDSRPVEGVTIMPLMLHSWLLTGFLYPHRDAVGPAIHRTAAMQASYLSSDSDGDSKSSRRVLRTKGVDGEVIPSMEDEPLW